MFSAFVVSLTEVLFQPDIKANEKIATSHLLNLQFWGAGASVAPGDGDRGPSKAAHNRLEWYLHRDVEMGRDKRTTPIDYFLAIGFKGVGGVVELDIEKKSQEQIHHAVNKQLQTRVIDYSATFHESAPKDTLVTFV